MKRFVKPYLLSLCLLMAGCSAVSTPASSTVFSSTAACGDEGEFGCAYKTKDAAEQESESFTKIDFAQAIDWFKSGKSGLLYFGFPNCPWCQEVLPILQAKAVEAGVEVFYVQTRDDAGELLYTDEQREEIAPYLKEFITTTEDGELKLYVPLVLAVVDGEVAAGHQGTVDEHDAHEREMTEEEKEEVSQEIEKILATLKTKTA